MYDNITYGGAFLNLCCEYQEIKDFFVWLATLFQGFLLAFVMPHNSFIHGSELYQGSSKPLNP